MILEKLFGVVKIDFEDIESVLSDYKEKLNIKAMEALQNEHLDKGIKKLYQEYLNHSSKNEYAFIYDASVEEDNFKTKFKEYFKKFISDEVSNTILRKASLIFLEKGINFLSEIISENVKDEEIKDIADSNLDKILKKIEKI